MSENIQRVETLFNQALEFRPDERAAFLAGACGQDTTLLTRLQTLLSAHEVEGILADQPQNEAGTPRIAERPGDCIGHYKLLQQIGEGGCGVVYMAEQEQPVRRRVALKVIKLGMDTKNVVARFEAERQALALMDHPNIAKVFDAGTTQSGRPYFVMELVRGSKITDYCDQNNLPTAQRLDLVMQVCRAIQHAHQKGIIHRDIKPSNVLVTVHDGTPVPKVIDFGIAKAIEGRLTDQTLFTSFEQFIGTPAYMSPEQAELNGLDVDTRTDIYSLGVLLYELLTGKTPFDAKDLLSAGLDEMRRTIRQQDPPRPSTRLTMELAKASLPKHEQRHSDRPSGIESKKPQASGVSTHALLQTRELINVLRGDLDWIVMKCLEKDRTRRYETANGLAMDLDRHLKSEPVTARPPSNYYRLQKLIRRNKLTFLAAAAVTLALVLGMVASTLEAIRARQAERAQGRLRQEADAARAGEAGQRAAAEQHLYDALLGEARAKQLTGHAGQRFESLDAISKAAAIRSSTELSDAAVAAFALPDLREEKHWRFPSHSIAENVHLDDSFELYAYRTVLGITIRRIRDDQEMAFLPVKDVADMANGILPQRFDPRSHYFCAACLTRYGAWRCRVWDIARGGALVMDLPSDGYPDFTPDGQAIAVVNPDDTISIREIDSGKELKRFRIEGSPDTLRFNPEGTKLAALQRGSSTLEIGDAGSGRTITSLVSSGRINIFAWNHDGALLATGGEDGRISVWDSQSGRVLVRMDGHESRVTVLAFSHQGDLLASEGWDSTLRLWDLARGRQLLIYRTQDTDLTFSRDDRMLSYCVDGETTRLLEVAHTTGYRRLDSRGAARKSWTGDFSPDGRLLAVSTRDGIVIWDVMAGKELGFVQTPICHSAHFQTNAGLGLVASTGAGLYRWPLDIESTSGGSFLRVGAPQILLGQQELRYSALDRSGGKVLASIANVADPVLVDLADPTNLLRLHGHAGAEFVALAPGGRWAATGTWKRGGVKVYDAAAGRDLRKLPIKGTALVAFSPDDNWLATATMTELRFWKTGSWEPCTQSIPGDRVSEINPLAFSPDGRLLAAVRAANEIQIVKVPTCEVIATLRGPTLAHFGAVSFSPDGTKLAAIEWSGEVNIWDLPLIRGELSKLNLDWKLPPFPSGSDVSPTGPAILQLDAGPFGKEELARTIPARNANVPANLVDLTDYYNAPLTQSWHSPEEAHNDLSELPRGVQKLGGSDFDIRGLIQIGTTAANGLSYPNHIYDLPIRQRCRRLHFLHAAIFSANARAGDELGSYIFHYTDGRQVEMPIITGKDTGEWWSQSDQQDMKFVIAWTGNNPAAQKAGHTLRLFKATWENPYPDVTIRHFDFVSDKPSPGAPFLLAITAEP